jgi:hypothetical protein
VVVLFFGTLHVHLNGYSFYYLSGGLLVYLVNYESLCCVFSYARLKVEDEMDGVRNPYFGKEL